MPVSVGRSLAIIFTVAGTIFFTRLIPFLFFPKGKEIPPIIRYLGRVLPPAVIGMLVIYCLKNVSVLAAPFGLPEFIAGGHRASCMEAQQSAQHWCRNGTLYVFDTSCILGREEEPYEEETICNQRTVRRNRKKIPNAVSSLR